MQDNPDDRPPQAKPPRSGEGLAIASFVVGLASLYLALLFPVALILGFASFSGRRKPSLFAIAGITLGFIGFALWLLITLWSYVTGQRPP